MKNLEKIIFWYENLNRESLNSINLYYSDRCYFKDPFHQIYKLEELKKIYSKMFDKLEKPYFKVIDSIEDQNKAVLIWDFYFNNKKQIHGSSVLYFDTSGKIIKHIDYWDTTEEIWLKIPIIRFFIKIIYKLLF